MEGHAEDSSLPQSPGGRVDPGQCSCYSVFRCEEKLQPVSRDFGVGGRKLVNTRLCKVLIVW